MALTCTLHLEDEVNCRFGGLRPEHLEILWEKFGVFVDGYFHMPAYQLRRWDGKIRFFEKNGKSFVKILDEILPYVCSWGYEVDIIDKRHPAPVIKDRIDETFFGLDTFQLRPYQVDVINALVEEGSGFAICATGSGKTSMCAALSMVLHLNGLQTLIIVPSSDLVTQTVNEFRERLQNYPVTIGEYSGSQKDIDHPIVVATWQSLQNVPDYMNYFQAMIVDECFSGEMRVLTPNGPTRIDKLRIGDEIYNSDLNGNLLIDEIVEVHQSLPISSSEEMLELIFDENVIVQVTANHKFYTNRGWVRADELTNDDEIEDVYKYISNHTMRVCNERKDQSKT
jgi:hypothetical protein